MWLGWGICSTQALPVWMNEFHYDNTSGDTGEFVEVAGVAGTDLSTYSIVLYNGNGGAPYGTISLSGLIDDESNGYGALAFSQVGIQNGAPDGLALFDGTTLLQFLSYEGSFTGVGGVAGGILSTDVVVSEPGAIGMSLQLIGTGTDYSDFSWTGPVAESPGSLNANQFIPEPTSTILPDGGSTSLLLGLGLGSLAIAANIRRIGTAPRR